ncbi:hypothetical protein EG68_07222 [Paragonimus skrjabini miyazakii]|uniref:Uncharacterized protein n=1 Tax=Paragonimus skrjabini miyazakii TaxID=59628 RepID=A0A8S9YMY4_9TREM|nr:hypothetical protein EG68_07222 [Paragonimus skrjabini miyazakii]
MAKAAALSRKINKRKARKRIAKLNEHGSNQAAQSSSQQSKIDPNLTDADGFILVLTKREKHFLQKSESNADVPNMPMECSEKTPVDVEPTEEDAITFSDDGLDSRSTVSKSWIRKHLKSPHQVGISKPGCKKQHTQMLRRALLRTRLHLQIGATAPLGLSKRDDVSKQGDATLGSGDHLKFISQWASRALGGTTDSNISKRKQRKKFRNKTKDSDGNRVREKKDVLISLKSQKSVVTHHAINHFRSLLAKF